jgi:hypothetical protein
MAARSPSTVPHGDARRGKIGRKSRARRDAIAEQARDRGPRCGTHWRGFVSAIRKRGPAGADEIVTEITTTDASFGASGDTVRQHG